VDFRATEVRAEAFRAAVLRPADLRAAAGRARPAVFFVVFLERFDAAFGRDGRADVLRTRDDADRPGFARLVGFLRPVVWAALRLAIAPSFQQP
jgi:hypothetical protein